MSPKQESGWRFLAHTADEGIELWAPSYEGLLAEGAKALFALMGEPAQPGLSEPITLDAEGIDREDLLVRFLHALLMAFEIDGKFLQRVDAIEVVEGNARPWRAELRGRAARIDRDREKGLMEIKAVTYHGISVVQEGPGWRARVLVDL